MRKHLVLLLAIGFVAMPVANAAIITVTTTNNLTPGTNTSLAQAIANLQNGDTIRFNIPGPGPFYIATPANGYPLITNNNVTIDGYSQPGAMPNTNPILAPNNAQLKIVLDSRDGGFTLMDFAKDQPTDDNGFGTTEGAILPVLNGTNFHVQGICFLGQPKVSGGAVSLYFVALAKYASGAHVSGCWMGVDLDRISVFSGKDGVAGFRYQQSDETGAFTNSIFINDTLIGVRGGATNAPSQFNVIVGAAIPVIVEGNNTRIAGNFLQVLPDGAQAYLGAFDPNTPSALRYESAIEIGRSGTNTLIGTDGDGVNDANERNIIGGLVPKYISPAQGYDHNIEFYGVTGTNIVIAGNYIGVGIDAVTQFTNGVPAVEGKTDGSSGTIRVGSDFDGVSDAVEANRIFNNYPPELFPASGFPAVTSLNFFDGIPANAGTTISLRGNVLVNNFPPPVSPARTNTLIAYYSKALANAFDGVFPALSTNTTRTRLIGTVPIANNDFPNTVIDLYLADPVGITNGQATMYEELPFGFVQGKTYLGSFVPGSASDLNPNPGEFEFDISGINIPVPAPVLLTVAASYSRDPLGTHNARTLTSPFSDPITMALSITSITKSGSNLTINWAGGTPPYQLQTRTNVASGEWNNVGGSTSATSASVPISGTTGFYRVQGQ